MSFCPECGKAVGASAQNCASCGFALPVGEKQTGGAARFKGTMMMAAPAIGWKPGEAANANAKPAEAPAVKAAAPATVAAGGAPAMRKANVGPVIAASTPGGAAAAPRAVAKMTMMGPGIAPMVAKAPAPAPAAPARAVPQTPPPQAAGIAATQAMPGPPPAPPMRAESAKAKSAPAIELPNTEPHGGLVQPDARRVDQASLDAARRIDREHAAAAVGHVATQVLDPAVADAARQAGRLLPGDPMAPQPTAAARPAAPRLALSSQEGYIVPRDDKKWLIWAICGAVLLSVLLLAIGLF